MKKIILLTSIFCCYIFNSCEPSRGDVLNVTRLYFKNSTNYTIKLLPYKDGLVITDSIKLFAPNTLTFLESNRYFYNSNPGFDFKYQRVTDSILVIFDGIKKEKHLRSETKPVQRPILPNIERSLYSIQNDVFVPKIIEQRKNFIEVEFTYTFIEQDYLDAEPN